MESTKAHEKNWFKFFNYLNLNYKKKGEAQKFYAEGVLSSFTRKFEGETEKSVDNLIAEAMSEENLSKMYEGWTAWI